MRVTELQQIISQEFEKNLAIFQDDIYFGFIFGSVAKGTYRPVLEGGSSDCGGSDLDTFVCVRRRDEGKVKAFIEWSIRIQLSMNLCPDERYPVEVFTLDEIRRNLDEVCAKLDQTENVNDRLNLSFMQTLQCSCLETYDAVFTIAVVASPVKMGLVIKDTREMFDDMVDDAANVLQRIVDTILINLSGMKMKDLPISLRRMFPGKSKGDIIQALRNLKDGRQVLKIVVEWP